MKHATGNGRNGHTAQWPWVSAVLVGVGGAVLSLFLHHASAVAETRAIERGFRLEAANLRSSVEQEIRLFEDVLDSIRQLHALSDQISAADFDEFVARGMIYQRAILGGFGFAQIVDDATRKLLEQTEPGTGGAGLAIVESDGAGGSRPAGTRGEYFPLTYQTPAGVLGVPVGFDFGSSEACRRAIGRMYAGGRPALGPPIAPGGLADESDFYLFSPILYPSVEGVPVAPPGYPVGFAVALFRPQVVLARALQHAAAHDLDVRLLGPDAAAPPAATLTYDAPVSVADTAWTFRCGAGPDYVGRNRGRRPELILAGGLVLTVLLTSELLLAALRARKVEKLVLQRTADLREAKTRLEQEMSERMRLEKEILEISTREKLRVGQDLHDSLGQKLTGAVFLSRALADRMADAKPDDRDSARHINELLREALGQVRRIARGLAPVELGEEGLTHALRRLAADTRDTFGVACDVHADKGVRASDDDAAVHLYHIAQEAVNNAIRHGKARRIGITLSAEDDGGLLMIEDDGSGIPDAVPPGQGLGLQIMRYRAAMIGGALEVGRGPEGGTVVSCTFGLPA